MKKFQFKNASFIKSASTFKGCPKIGDASAEVAVCGRSNVGKSSLLNDLFQVKGLVKTSQVPGKTRLLNFFQTVDRVIFCDLPGYGYAKISKKEQSTFAPMIEEYLEKREELDALLLLLDIRRLPSKEDLSFLSWIEAFEKPLLIVFTKIDKLSKNQIHAQVKKNFEAIGFKAPHVLYSATKKIGRDHLVKSLNEILCQP
jgi:GTP-binding protein